MSEKKSILNMGWLPDRPDIRDFYEEHEKVVDALRGIGVLEYSEIIPELVSLRRLFSPVEDQEQLGSCTAHAGVGLIEYFQRKVKDEHIDASRLFLYKVTRNLLQLTGDTGAYLRTTMAAMVLFGVPPEKYWPYIIEEFDVEPSAFCYSFGKEFQTLKYLRLDTPLIGREALLKKIKKYIAFGIPAMFGFTVYNSYYQARANGEIPFPSGFERVIGGHAVVAMGFDDNKVIKNNFSGEKTKGALEIRNSYGSGWGDEGYGWLPYEYVLRGMAIDWWTLMDHEWVDLGRFGIDA